MASHTWTRMTIKIWVLGNGVEIFSIFSTETFTLVWDNTTAKSRYCNNSVAFEGNQGCMMSRKMRRKHIHYLSMLLVFRDCRIFFGSVASPETKNMIPDAVVGSMGGDAGALLSSASRQRSAGIGLGFFQYFCSNWIPGSLIPALGYKFERNQANSHRMWLQLEFKYYCIPSTAFQILQPSPEL